ncbi:MAG: hypothetical protein ACSHXD_01145 [Marinosulfonomonas sp.]
MKVLKTTILGGILFLVPFVFIIYIGEKAFSIARMVTVPIHDMLPNGGFFGINLLLLCLLGLFCFGAGILAEKSIFAKRAKALDQMLVQKMPGYFQMKSILSGHLGDDEGSAMYIPVIVRDKSGAVRLGFQVETNPNGYTVVFFPSVPNPQTGHSAAVPTGSVEQLDIPLPKAMDIFQFSGRGLAELIAEHDAKKITDQT